MILCRFENGGKGKLRHVTVKALTVNDKGEVLLIKRAQNLLRGGKYDIPGGFLDRDENSREGALRELFEETGIRGKIQFLFRINDNPERPNEDRQNLDIIYVVKSVKGRLKIDSESTRAGWFSRKNLPPEEEFAFDHRDSILRYFKYLKQPEKLPIVG
ncbi:NUDIX domain-containing protein [Patescibacteria group bacterium]|nr:NUDIX domain-containing protein [Patescibacteria group bacterium]